MAANPSVKLDYRSRRLVGQIVEHVKSQGIFDQFRRDCIDELEQKESYRQLKQRVESHVATFLSKQTWTDALPKNQVRDSLRRHINQSEVLERGVKQLISQALENKAKSFQTRIEGVVQNYIYMQQHQQNQDKQNRRYNNKALEEKGDVKPSTSETKHDVVSDITQLIPIPVPSPAGAASKTESHASDKGKSVPHDGMKSVSDKGKSVPHEGAKSVSDKTKSVVQESAKSVASSKSSQQLKKAVLGRTTALAAKGEGKNAGSPLYVEKEQLAVSVEESIKILDDKTRISRVTVESCRESQNVHDHQSKDSDEVKIKVEPEALSLLSEKPDYKKSPESDETVKSSMGAKIAEKFDAVKRVAGVWVTQSSASKDPIDVPVSVTSVKSEIQDKSEDLKETEESVPPGDKLRTAIEDQEKTKLEVPQDMVAEGNLNTRDEKFPGTCEVKTSEIFIQSSPEKEVLSNLPTDAPVVNADASSVIHKTLGQSVEGTEVQSFPPVHAEHSVKTETMFDVSGQVVLSRAREEWEQVSSAGDHSDAESDISEVSSVHTSDLSSFDEEISSLSASYDDDDDDERDGDGGEADKRNNEGIDGNEGTSSVQSEQNPNTLPRRRSTRISSRRSTKEEDDEVSGNDGQTKERNRDSPRRKRRGRRRRRELETPPQMSEGQSESSPIKRRRGRPRKDERRISSSSDNQRRHSRWHSQEDSESAATEKSSSHSREASRRKRSQRQIKRTRCYSPSSEGTREVFLPCKRSRTGSKE